MRSTNSTAAKFPKNRSVASVHCAIPRAQFYTKTIYTVSNFAREVGNFRAGKTFAATGHSSAIDRTESTHIKCITNPIQWIAIRFTLECSMVCERLIAHLGTKNTAIWCHFVLFILNLLLSGLPNHRIVCRIRLDHRRQATIRSKLHEFHRLKNRRHTRKITIVQHVDGVKNRIIINH